MTCAAVDWVSSIRCFLAAEWGRWNLLFNKWHATLWCQPALCPVGTCPEGAMPWHSSVCLTCTCFLEGRIQVCYCFCSKQMLLSPADNFPPIADYVSCCFGGFFHKIRVSGSFSIIFMLCVCCQHFWLIRKPALLTLISDREKTSLPLQASVVTTARKKYTNYLVWRNLKFPLGRWKFSGLLEIRVKVAFGGIGSFEVATSSVCKSQRLKETSYQVL